MGCALSGRIRTDVQWDTDGDMYIESSQVQDDLVGYEEKEKHVDQNMVRMNAEVVFLKTATTRTGCTLMDVLIFHTHNKFKELSPKGFEYVKKREYFKGKVLVNVLSFVGQIKSEYEMQNLIFYHYARGVHPEWVLPFVQAILHGLRTVFATIQKFNCGVWEDKLNTIGNELKEGISIQAANVHSASHSRRDSLQFETDDPSIYADNGQYRAIVGSIVQGFTNRPN